MGTQVRQLRVSQRDHRPDIVYAIGINIRPGRGRYRNTNIVTLSPRFQLHNKSSYQLQFAQKCLATTLVPKFYISIYSEVLFFCCYTFFYLIFQNILKFIFRMIQVLLQPTRQPSKTVHFLGTGPVWIKICFYASDSSKSKTACGPEGSVSTTRIHYILMSGEI